ncbi:protein phosphatase 1 regulatory subunit 12B isoform X2 [Chanos chanos]|uniref:Protein phosphatase 1 regulatory subunit 12B isoform X2 n=1 Tax=Chanos chanos TaxID=29144 RepID=A0A6J2UYV9_CHACN|nr:protein phosphatase 1 regulatory subunit 12B-like isoform X2 [Chanos chanos]
MSSLYSRSKDPSRARKPLSDPPPSPSSSTNNFRHARTSRLDSSSGEAATDKLMSRTSSYTRRENRLASLNKAEDDTGSRDYKKLYEDALTENEKLKSRLEESKQELAKIRTQLDKVTQRQDRMSERSSVFQSERKEKQALERRVTDMEEELKTPPMRFRCGYQP